MSLDAEAELRGPDTTGLGLGGQLRILMRQEQADNSLLLY